MNEPVSDQIFIVDESYFIDKNIKKCHVMFDILNLKFKKINVRDTNIVYKLSSSNLHYSEILYSNDNEYVYLPKNIASNNDYSIEFLRSDSVENDVLLYKYDFSITDITLNSLIYNNKIIIANMTLFCYDESLNNLFSIDNTNLKSCKKINSLLICDFEVNLSIKESYELKYNSNK